MFSLKDRVALVTGASQGIGRAIALALSCAGARVVIAARNAEKLQILAQEIDAAHGMAFPVKMDVADQESVKTGFRQAVEHAGRLDILVNNAAITRDGLAIRMKAEDWEAVLRTNLTGAHFCIQQALAVMLRQRSGRIINVTSVVAESGNAGQGQNKAEHRKTPDEQDEVHQKCHAGDDADEPIVKRNADQRNGQTDKTGHDAGAN